MAFDLSVRTRLWFCAIFVMLAGVIETPALAQVACVAGKNPGPCMVSPGQVIDTEDVTTNGDGHSIVNAGRISTIVATEGVNSSLTNLGTVDVTAQTLGDNSALINAGVIVGDANTAGDNSVLINTGRVGGGCFNRRC